MNPANVMPWISRRRLLRCGAGLAAAAAAPGGALAASAVAGKEDAAKAAITVGALFPETGPLSLPGSEAFRGVLLALDAAGRQAGKTARPIQLVRAAAVDAEGATKAAQALIKTSKASIILGTCSSTLSFAASAAAELANIPYIELDAPADDITTRGFKMLARTGLTTAELAGTAAGFLSTTIAPRLLARHRALKLGLLFDTGATAGAFAQAMTAACAAAKLPVTISRGYAADTSDLVEQAGEMKRAGVDVVVHAGNPDGVLQFFEAMAILAWRPGVVIGAGTGYALASIGFVLGPAIEGTYVVGAPDYREDGPSAAVARLYRDRFAAAPRGAASLTTYSGALPVFAALMAGKAMPGALEAAKAPAPALANGWGLAFNAAGQNTASFATLRQWRNGRLAGLDEKGRPGALPLDPAKG